MKLEPYVQYGLIIDGVSLGIALNSCPTLLRKVAMACEAVVCCRMSPLQKSQVHLIKTIVSMEINLYLFCNLFIFCTTDGAVGQGGTGKSSDGGYRGRRKRRVDDQGGPRGLGHHRQGGTSSGHERGLRVRQVSVSGARDSRARTLVLQKTRRTRALFLLQESRAHAATAIFHDIQRLFGTGMGILIIMRGGTERRS